LPEESAFIGFGEEKQILASLGMTKKRFFRNLFILSSFTVTPRPKLTG